MYKFTKKTVIMALLLTINSCSNTFTSFYLSPNKSQDALEKEYVIDGIHFSTKALSQNYVTRKFNKFLNPLNEAKVIKELVYAGSKYFDILKSVMNANPVMFNIIKGLTSVINRRSAEPSFDQLIKSLEPPLVEINWAMASNLPPMGNITAIAADPNNPDIMYSLGINGQFGDSNKVSVFKSINAGASWTKLTINGLPTGFSNSTSLLMADSATLYAAFEYGIYKSTDSGLNWLPIKNGLPNGMYLGAGLVMSHNDSNTLYTVSPYSQPYGVFQTTDGGANWNPMNNGIDLNTFRPDYIAMDPTDSNNLWISGTGVSNFCGTGGVYKSTDGGANWSPSPSQPPTCLASIAVAAGNLTAFAGYFYTPYKTTNGGSNWSPAGTNMAYDTTVSHIFIDPDNSSIVFAPSSEYGFYRSSNGGSSWTITRDTFSAPRFRSSIIKTSNGYYATTAGGIFKSTDNGASWSISDTGVNLSLESGFVTVNPSIPNMVYLGTRKGIYRSTDAGNTWSHWGSGISGNEINNIVFEPGNSATMYAGTPGGIFKSINGGQTWINYSWDNTSTKIYNYFENYTAIAVNPANVNNIFTGLAQGGLYKTTDFDNDIWTELTGTVFDYNSTNFKDIVFDPADSNIIYALTEGSPTGLFKSTNGGDTWNPVNSNANGFIAFHPTAVHTIYTNISGQGLSKSTNGGDTWNLINSGMGNENTLQLVFDRNNSDIIYAITNGNEKVYRTINGGTSWSTVNTGLPLNTIINHIALDTSNTFRLYLATNNGLYVTN